MKPPAAQRSKNKKLLDWQEEEGRRWELCERAADILFQQKYIILDSETRRREEKEESYLVSWSSFCVMEPCLPSYIKYKCIISKEED